MTSDIPYGEQRARKYTHPTVQAVDAVSVRCCRFLNSRRLKHFASAVWTENNDTESEQSRRSGRFNRSHPKKAFFMTYAMNLIPTIEQTTIIRLE
jgi:hypothetical protein